MASVAVWNLTRGIKAARVYELENMRLELNLTIAEMSELLDISPASYHRMKRLPDKILDPATSCLVGNIRSNHLEPMLLTYECL